MSGPEPLFQVRLRANDVVAERFRVKKKLGEGSCGTVYKVEIIKRPTVPSAMKIEPLMKKKEDEILKMEHCVLRRLQTSKHACRLYYAGKSEKFTFIVMARVGRELTDLRRRQPDKRMSVVSSLRVGLQSLQAISDLHAAGFIHRDIKPTNFACGFENRGIIYMFDFGLSRQIMLQKGGKLELRPPRQKVPFRGTVRYCSLNAHRYKELGRHDDLWGMLYMLVELRTAALPWKTKNRTESEKIKEKVPDAELFMDCPPSFLQISSILKKLAYKDDPDYAQLRKLLDKDLERPECKGVTTFEWEKMGKEKAEAREVDHDEKAVIEQTEEPTDTTRDADEGVDSVASDTSNADSDGAGYDRENTMDAVSEVRKADDRNRG